MLQHTSYISKVLSPQKITSQLFAFFITTAFAFFISSSLSGSVLAAEADNVVTMGRNESGQLGIGTFDFNAHGTPSVITDFSGITSVSSATSNSYAVKADGTVWGWGNNELGQIGDNTTTRRTTPVQVLGPGGVGYLTNVKTVAAYSYSAFAIKNDGTVWAWGSNTSGKLGDNTTTQRLTPVQVVGPGGVGYLTDIVAVSAGDNGHTVALKSDGTVWSWGGNGKGQLGDGTTSTRLAPVQVVGPGGVGYLTDIISVGAGRVSAAALKNDGTVWTWGAENAYGQLGNGTHTASATPVQVHDTTGAGYLSNVTNIYVGHDRAFAKTQDKKIWGWGENNLGQLGNGSTGTHFTRPVESTYLYGVMGISTGYNHSIAFSDANEAPILDPIGNKTVNEGELLQFTISATDPDGDMLTYSAANLPAGATFDTQTHTFTWTPGFDQEGNYPDIEFTVTDNGNPMELDMESITVTVGGVNRAPVFAPVGSQEVLENESLTFTVSATDPDGDSITLSASNMPQGASFDPQTGTFSWTPTLSQSGNYVVTFNATDNGIPFAIGYTDVAITVGDNPTPTEQAEQLVDIVVTYDFPTNVENSYLANLKKVAKFIEEGKVEAAINQLNAFISKVESDYSEGIITQEERNNLVNLAQALIDDLQ